MVEAVYLHRMSLGILRLLPVFRQRQVILPHRRKYLDSHRFFYNLGTMKDASREAPAVPR